MYRRGALRDNRISSENHSENQPDIDIVGHRVRFRSAYNHRSVLKFNDLGTVVGVTGLRGLLGREIKLWIKWDSGRIYPLIDGKDSFDIFSEAGI
jgi:hypothetical protein